MFEYELSQARSADLLRRAEHERRAREAVRLARAARHDAEPGTAESESHTGRTRRHRSPRVT